MVIWSGRGWVGFVAVIVLGIPIQLVAESQGIAYQSWPLSITFTLTGALCWMLGSAWNRPVVSEIAPRPANRHRLFFVPLQWWGPIAWVGAVVNAVVWLS